MGRTDKEFIIPFVGLKLGNHTYEFEITDSFFEHYEYSLIQQGSLNAHLKLEKKETMLLADFEVSGTVHVPCDRCNGEMQIPIEASYQLIYKFGLEQEDDESLVVLHPDEYEINVKDPLYELITVSLPTRSVHKEGECDEEMLEAIKAYTINADDAEEDDEWDDDDDFDADEDDEDDEDTWEILRKLN